jgi:hypothetical protein
MKKYPLNIKCPNIENLYIGITCNTCKYCHGLDQTGDNIICLFDDYQLMEQDYEQAIYNLASDYAKTETTDELDTLIDEFDTLTDEEQEEIYINVDPLL